MISASIRIGVICIVVNSFVSVGLAQPAANKPEPATAGTADDIKTLKAQIDALAKKVQSGEEVNAKERTENAQMRAKLEELQAKQEMGGPDEDADLAALEGEEFKPSFDVYGFMDIGLLYSQLYKTNAIFGPVPDKPSFFQNQINLYFSSKITESLNALVELRFSYLPHGADKNYAIPQLGPDSKYSRVNSTVYSPTSSQELTFNGVIIDRAVVSWTPYDFLGFRAGRFITPFGIWNVDHSPTVILPIRLPYIITMGPIPLRQTGVEAFGRVFPITNTYLEYGVSLSNGRGPTEEIYDLDNNKALGFRLKGAYNVGDLSVALGGYLYSGLVTDIKKSYFIDSSGVKLTSEPTVRYSESAGSGDLSISFKGLKIQGEYARSLVKYSKRPTITYLDTDVASGLGLYWPDYTDWNAYGLVAYELGFTVANKEMTVVPFVMYEYNACNGNVYPQLVFTDIRGGFAYRPITAVALKYELSYYTVKPKQYVSVAGQGKKKSNSWENQVQVAVSF
jgi:hypothetical protein